MSEDEADGPLFLCGDPTLLAQVGWNYADLKERLGLVLRKCAFCAADVCCDRHTDELLRKTPNGRVMCFRCLCSSQGIPMPRLPQ